MNKVIVVGSGGREHALAWKLSRSPSLQGRPGSIVVAPGNPGMPETWERWALDLSGDLAQRRREFARFAAKAKSEGVDLVVVGPDNPLADGIVDVLVEAGVPAFGPTAAAAQIEASKVFAKEIMQRAAIPTAKCLVAHSKAEARKVLRSIPWREGEGWVLKFDGLALGKGVFVCEKPEEALAGLEGLPDGSFVIEEKLTGEEISWLAFCDGEHCALLEPARDHKRLGDGNSGPNTGGMGAYSPVAGIPAQWSARVREEIFLPALREMKKRGTPFKGLLYAGLMVDVARDRIWVLEFNARFGDPETQALMLRMDSDLLEWCAAVAGAEGKSLSDLPAQVPFSKKWAVAVVAAAEGYPDAPKKGARISGPKTLLETESVPNPEYFLAGVAGVAQGGGLQVSGGRVLAALGLGESLAQASRQAYERLSQVRFDGIQFRKDIGREGRA